MANSFATILKNLYKLVNVDTNNLPTTIQNQYLPAPTNNQLGAVKAGTGITIGSDGTISSSGASLGVTSLAVGAAGAARTGAIKLLAGSNVFITDNSDGTFTWSATGGGGGSATIITSWASGGQNKDAYTSFPTTVNAQGINLTITLSSGANPVITNITIGGVNVLGVPYMPSGSFPNYTLAIDAANLSTLIQTNGGVVLVSGMISGNNFFTTSSTLTTNQPVPFSTSLSASYTSPSNPFYTTTSTVNYSYANAGSITSFAGVLTPVNTPSLPKNANLASGSFAGVDSGGLSISGSATGVGTAGAGSSTVTLSGSVMAVPTYIPAFYQQTSSAALPTWATSTTQTPGSQNNATVTFPVAQTASQYNWIATTAPQNKVFIVTTFGNVPISPDASGTVVIGTGSAATTFNVFGVTGLTTAGAMQFFVSA